MNEASEERLRVEVGDYTGGTNGKLPVTVVTGFLGSGKTTLLSRILKEPALSGTAVLVNEIGEIGLDHHLLERVDETTVLLENGCVCCTRRGELAEALRDLLASESRVSPGGTPVERVVVETSGLADPSPIPYTILSDPILRHHYAPSRVVATADAVNGRLHLSGNPESVAQIAASDTVFITKEDLASEAMVENLHSMIREINPYVGVIRTDPLLAPDIFSTVFGVGHTGESAEDFPSRSLQDAGTRSHSGETPQRADPGSSHRRGPGEVETLSLTFEKSVDWTAFGVWLSALLHAHGEKVLRVKGLLDTGDPGPVSVNGVQHVIHPPAHLEQWPKGEDGNIRYGSFLIFVVKGIDAGLISESLRAFELYGA